jgi:threonyl-tRNA synthetase
MAVVGKEEAEGGYVNLRSRDEKDILVINLKYRLIFLNKTLNNYRVNTLLINY